MLATNNGAYPWRGTVFEAELAGAMPRLRPGGVPTEEIRVLLDRATRGAIEDQIGAGLDLITDGMVRRGDPVSYLVAHLSGLVPGETRADFPGRGVPYIVPVVASEVSWTGPILVEDFLFAGAGTANPVKVVLTGPYTLARVAEDHAYGDPMALATALAAALNLELRSLQAAGARFLQVDEPALLQNKEDFPIFTRIWEVLGRGVTATLCLHLEGGTIDGLYPGIARLKRIGCLSLDCVRGRGNLDLLSAAPLPETLQLGLGVIDGRDPGIESPEAIAALVRAAKARPSHERILIGTASDLGGLPAAVASAKMRSLARAARLLERDVAGRLP